MFSDNDDGEQGEESGPVADDTREDDNRGGGSLGNEIPADETRGNQLSPDGVVKETSYEGRELGLVESENAWEQFSPPEELEQLQFQQFAEDDEMAGDIPSDIQTPAFSPDVVEMGETFGVPGEPIASPLTQIATDDLSAARMSRGKILSSRRLPSEGAVSLGSDERPMYRIATHVVSYKKAAKVIQNPLRPDPKVCPKPEVTVWRYAGPDRALDIERATLDQYKSMCSQSWSPNTTATDPTRARRWVDSPRGVRGKSTEDWKFEEERTKERRDHELALELGYETLVGNLLYIDIPNTKDIHRSWQNYLSQDKMEWGFPYYKGSIERPRMRQPEPYLAHQVVEKLWKYPKARMTRSVTEDQDLSTS